MDNSLTPARATLHILTTEPEAPDNLVPLGVPCDGSMTCECLRCQDERAKRIAQGVRRRNPIPTRRRQAA